MVRGANRRSPLSGSVAFSLMSYVFIFLMISFILTCSIMLFLQGAPLPEEFIRRRAPRTFANIFILSFMFTIITMTIKYVAFDRPMNKIALTARQIASGNFSARVHPDRGNPAVRQLVDFQDVLNEIACQIQSVEGLQEEFLSNVSHEMKTPLAVIKNYTSLLRQPNVAESDKEAYCAVIESHVQNLSSLVTNVLKLNKLENQRVCPEYETFDLGELVCEVVLSFEHLWEEKDIDLQVNIQQELLVRSDRTFLMLVCSNLVSNALKFTPPGGKVWVSCQQNGAIVDLRVQDTGCGMGEETGRHIFEKFYQGDTSHQSLGNGLGLALVKRIIDVLGGEISVSSTLGQGSTFSVRLDCQLEQKVDGVEELPLSGALLESDC